MELPSDMLAPGRAVFSELLALNRREADAFNEIVSDYLASMQINRELQVRHPFRFRMCMHGPHCQADCSG